MDIFPISLHNLHKLSLPYIFIAVELFNVSPNSFYRAFRGFWQAKFSNGDLVLGSSPFLFLLQLPQKMTLNSKVVKINSKLTILLPSSK